MSVNPGFLCPGSKGPPHHLKRRPSEPDFDSDPIRNF
jgi:hypothetical protein